MPAALSPPRFRRRLTAAFVLVAAVTGGVLAASSYFLIRQHRTHAFAEQAEEEATLSLLSAPAELTLPGFEALLAEYQSRAGFDTVVVSGDVVFSSSPEFTLDDVPSSLRRGGALDSIRTDVGGEPYLVIAGMPDQGSGRFYFFFSRVELVESVDDVGNVLAVAWFATVLVAAVFGEWVAGRTLRPVAAAAEASRSLAEGLLHTRLEQRPYDEFGDWTASFNRMAEALETKVADLARAAERERRFTSDVAHELRTPVAGMASAASLLEEELDAVGPSARRPAKLLVDDARRMQVLVVELLELARHDAGQEQVNLEPLRLAEAVSVVARSWDGGSAITTDVDEGLVVMADRTRLRRVLGNLVANALEHGGCSVTVSAHVEQEWVVIDVVDRGPGITPSDLPHVFERFFKADTSRGRGGSGLGLSIASANARLQGGGLEVANREGGGARFRLRLPLAQGPC